MPECRFCFESSEPLINPCKCDGSLKFVHKKCLETWIQTSRHLECNVCKTPFKIHNDSFIRTTKFLNILHVIIMFALILIFYKLDLSLSWVIIIIILNCSTINKIQDYYETYEINIDTILQIFDESLMYRENCLVIFFFNITYHAAKIIQLKLLCNV